MPDRSLTSALGLLLSDASLRWNFGEDRRATAERMALLPEDLQAFLDLDAGALECQAAALLDKRRHEVARLLPRTFGRLGCRGVALFLDYARTAWPEGHDRHAVDALGFCLHLEHLRVPELDSSEFRRLQFLQGRSRVAFHWVPNGIRGGLPGLHMLLRRPDGMRQGILALGPYRSAS